MFPHEYKAESGYQEVLRGRPSLLPSRLPRPQSSLNGSIDFQDQRMYDATAAANPHLQRAYSVRDQSRGRSFEDEESVYLHRTLPSVSTIMPPIRQAQEHQSLQFQQKPTDSRHRPDLPEVLYERPQSQAYPAAPSTTEPLTLPLRRVLSPLSGLSAFADPQLFGMQSSRLSNQLSPWSSVSVSRNIASGAFAIPWDDIENERFQQNRRWRRTSPRRRLAASKAHARALQMSMDREQTGILGHFERDHVGYHLHKRSRELTSPLFSPPPIMPSIGFSLSTPARPSSSSLVDESDTSPSKKSSRYLREMDRRLILARLDRGEKQSALAKEFQVTRAAICNLNKHRDLVLSRQHEDPLAKHPKKAKRKTESEDEAEPEDAAPSFRDGANRISLLLCDASPRIRQPVVHQVASQPAERLIPLLLSNETTDSAFRRYCDRLMTLVVEEVLAWTHTKINTTTSCGVSIAPGGSPMLPIFQTLEPDLPTGTINFTLPQTGSPVPEVVDLPTAMPSQNVCLFYAFTDAAGGIRVAESIRELLSRGAVEELLCLATLAVSALTVSELQRAHPNLRVAAAHVESQEDLDEWLQHNGHLENQPDGRTSTSNQISRLELLASRAAAIY